MTDARQRITWGKGDDLVRGNPVEYDHEQPTFGITKVFGTSARDRHSNAIEVYTSAADRDAILRCLQGRQEYEQTIVALQADARHRDGLLDEQAQVIEEYGRHIAALTADLTDIAEYWNGGAGSAMDAAEHQSDVARAALKRGES